MKLLLEEKVQSNEIDPSFVIKHKLKLRDGPALVQDVPHQAGSMHQGCPLEAVTE